MEATTSTQKPAAHVVIFINDERHTALASQMTGAEIKRLGNVPSGNRLYREEPGSHPDVAIPDDAMIKVKSGDKFYDLPSGVVGVGLLPSVQAQVDRLGEDYPLVDLRPQTDGAMHVIVGPVCLGPGWNRSESRVLIVLPLGYPQVRPSGFFAEPGILLETGKAPSGSGCQQVREENWTYFCWQPANWDHDRETLWRYVKFCERRFAEVLQ